MKHVCHLPTCDAACPPRHLFCRRHWSMVPKPIQREVYATVGARGRYVDESWAPWWRAQARAEAAVLRRLYPLQEDLIARRLAKELEFADTLEARHG